MAVQSTVEGLLPQKLRVATNNKTENERACREAEEFIKFLDELREELGTMHERGAPIAEMKVYCGERLSGKQDPRRRLWEHAPNWEPLDGVSAATAADKS